MVAMDGAAQAVRTMESLHDLIEPQRAPTPVAPQPLPPHVRTPPSTYPSTP